MRKKIFSLLLAVILCFGMTTSVMATESPEADDIPVPPTPGISWCEDGSWAITLDYMEAMTKYEGYYIRYSFEVYEGEEQVGMFGLGTMEPIEDFTYSISHWVNDNGDYHVNVRSYVMDEEGNQTFSDWVETELRTYTRPASELAAVSVQWDAERMGVLTFDSVEGASGYRCQLYHVEDGNGVYCGWADIEADAAISTYEAELDGFMWAGGEYYATVVALSSDVDSVANSPIVQSAILNTEDYATEDVVTDVAGEANTFEDAAEGLDYLVSNTTSEELAESMQNNEATRNEIATLEENYVAQQNITVAPTEVSEEAANYVNADEVGILGAGLNAEPDSEVKLAISVPQQEVSVSGNYAKMVQLDLKLLCNNNEVSELTVPVTIAIPVPTGISTDNLVILHYHDNATTGTPVTFSVEGGYIIFTVDSFSTFVFANATVVNNPTTPGTTTTTTTVVATSPKTGDNGMVWVTAVLGLALVGAVVLRKRAF